MSKIRLLKIFPSTTRGGAEEYAVKVVTAAISKGWDVHVAFPKRDSTMTLRHDLQKIGAFCHFLEIPPEVGERKQFLLQIVRTVILLLKTKPDAVLLSLPLPNQGMASMAACAILKIPTTVVFHLVLECIPIGRNIVRLCNWARKRNQRWVSVSDNNREILSKLFCMAKDDITLIYNGPFFDDEEDLLSNKTEIIRETRNELNISEEAIIILTVGRLSPQKGYSCLIQAVPHILESHPNVKFIWAGDGEQREELESLVKEYGVKEMVLFLGHRKDIPRLILASDLFLFPTLFEGCPLALFEAMVFGLPIVASRASGIPEVINDKVHGVLFRKADSCSLLAAVKWALEHPEQMKEMAGNASMRVNEFSSNKMTDKTLELVEALATAK